MDASKKKDAKSKPEVMLPISLFIQLPPPKKKKVSQTSDVISGGMDPFAGDHEILEDVKQDVPMKVYAVPQHQVVQTNAYKSITSWKDGTKSSINSSVSSGYGGSEDSMSSSSSTDWRTSSDFIAQFISRNSSWRSDGSMLRKPQQSSLKQSCERICAEQASRVLKYLDDNPMLHEFYSDSYLRDIMIYVILKCPEAKFTKLTEYLIAMARLFVESDKMKDVCLDLNILAWFAQREPTVWMSSSVKQSEISPFATRLDDKSANFRFSFLQETPTGMKFTHPVWNGFFKAFHLYFSASASSFSNFLSKRDPYGLNAGHLWGEARTFVRCLCGFYNRSIAQQLAYLCTDLPRDLSKKRQAIETFCTKHSAPQYMENLSEMYDPQAAPEELSFLPKSVTLNNPSISVLYMTASIFRSKKVQRLEITCEKSDSASNQIGDEGALVLSTFVDKIEELELNGNCSITSTGMQYLTTSIEQRNAAMNLLSLSWNEIGDEACIFISTCLNKINRLEMRDCRLTSKGLGHLAIAIQRRDKPLKLLDLSRNYIGYEGMSSISSCLQNIDRLELRDCQLTSKEIEKLTSAIQRIDSPLSLLDLSRNGIGGKTSFPISSCVSKISRLVLRNCKLEMKDIERLTMAIMESNTPLNLCDLSMNRIGIKAASLISASVGQIDQLEMTYCQSTSKAAKQLAFAIHQRDTPMQRVELHGNAINDEACQHIADCLHNVDEYDEVVSMNLLTDIGRRKIQTKVDELRKLDDYEFIDKKSCVVGSKGATMRVGGCIVDIPENALAHPIEIQLTSFYGRKHEDTNSITPMLKCEPHGLKFNEPVRITLPTCYITDDNQSVPVVVRTSMDRCSWKNMLTVMYRNNDLTISFPTRHFSIFDTLWNLVSFSKIKSLIFTKPCWINDSRRMAVGCTLIFADYIPGQEYTKEIDHFHATLKIGNSYKIQISLKAANCDHVEDPEFVVKPNKFEADQVPREQFYPQIEKVTELRPNQFCTGISCAVKNDSTMLKTYWIPVNMDPVPVPKLFPKARLSTQEKPPTGTPSQLDVSPDKEHLDGHSTETGLSRITNISLNQCKPERSIIGAQNVHMEITQHFTLEQPSTSHLRQDEIPTPQVLTAVLQDLAIYEDDQLPD